jgi:hypothetical protein
MRARELRLGFLLLSIATLAHGVQDRPAFENSLSYRSFYYSEGSFVSPSELELIDGKFPTDGTHYVYREDGEERRFWPRKCIDILAGWLPHLLPRIRSPAYNSGLELRTEKASKRDS